MMAARNFPPHIEFKYRQLGNGKEEPKGRENENENEKERESPG